MNKISLKKVASVTGLFLGAFALSVLAESWTPASCNAPDCNVAAPINVGPATQAKAGNLILNSTLSVGKETEANGVTLEVDGPGAFTGLRVFGLTNTNLIKVTAPGFDVAGNVLTTDGTGMAEWKPANGGGNGGGGNNGEGGADVITVVDYYFKKRDAVCPVNYPNRVYSQSVGRLAATSAGQCGDIYTAACYLNISTCSK